MDVAKITCRQYLTGKITTPRSVANWLSGYFHGERGDTTLDYGDLGANVGKVDAFCRKHHEMPLLEAARTVFGKRLVRVLSGDGGFVGGRIGNRFDPRGNAGSSNHKF